MGQGAEAQEPAEGTASRLIGRLAGSTDDARGDLITASFVLRARGGRITTDPGAPEFDRFLSAAAAATLEDAGGDYLIAMPESDGTVWLLRIQNEKLAAAFEFGAAGDAAAAVPRFNRSQSDVELVRTAIWAFVDRDVSALVRSLAEDFTYTDLEFGGSFAGASTAVGSLLLAHDDLQARGLADLGLRELPGGIVEASGVLTRESNEDPPARRRWTVIVGVEDDRIAWAVRRPDRPE